MKAEEHLIRNVSDTAMWTAAYRADESERPDALFRDPYARALAGERGAEIARQVKPAAVRYGVVLRTAVLDEQIARAVTERGADTVLNLAAGLDTRPYRLGLPADLRWVEVDLPEILEYKESVLAGETPACRLEREKLDLADAEVGAALFERVGAESRRVLVVTEGLLNYLPRETVAALATSLHAQPTFAEWLMDLSGAQVNGRVRSAGDKLMADGVSAKFAPEENSAFFEPFGWTEAEYIGLFEESRRLGRDSLLGAVLRLLMRLMPAERRRSLERALGIVRLERTSG